MSARRQREDVVENQEHDEDQVGPERKQRPFHRAGHFHYTSSRHVYFRFRMVIKWMDYRVLFLHHVASQNVCCFQYTRRKEASGYKLRAFALFFISVSVTGSKSPHSSHGSISSRISRGQSS